MKKTVIGKNISSHGNKRLHVQYYLNRLFSVGLVLMFYLMAFLVVGNKTDRLIDKRSDIINVQNEIFNGLNEISLLADGNPFERQPMTRQNIFGLFIIR